MWQLTKMSQVLKRRNLYYIMRTIPNPIGPQLSFIAVHFFEADIFYRHKKHTHQRSYLFAGSKTAKQRSFSCSCFRSIFKSIQSNYYYFFLRFFVVVVYLIIERSGFSTMELMPFIFDGLFLKRTKTAPEIVEQQPFLITFTYGDAKQERYTIKLVQFKYHLSYPSG